MELILPVLTISFIGFIGSVDSFQFDKVPSSRIWLTVSSQVHRKGIFSLKPIQRELLLNWRSIPIKSNFWLGLFDHPINVSTVKKVDAVYTLSDLNTPDGAHQTDIQFPIFDFQKSNPLISICLKYYLVLVEGDQIVEVNCIKSQPNWMDSILEKIGFKTIKSLVIPGTHNAGSYSIGYDAGIISGLLNSYTLCQDESVFNQLIYGNRYLDIRVRYDENNAEHFWIGHGDYPIQITLRDVLGQIKNFMDLTDNEIVILDFHRFPIGFNHDGVIDVARHIELLDLVQSIVGDHLADNSDGLAYDKTVNSLLANGHRRLILGHAEWQTVQKSFIFQNVQQVWAETDSIDQLSSYLNDNLCYNYPKAYAAMVQLTPEAIKFLLYGGLRKMAQSVNPLATEWFRLNNSLNQCANIIATDFFLGNNIIEIAIESNSNR